jgi:sporulation protein YlmC with PRC-barrel domain
MKRIAVTAIALAFAIPAYAQQLSPQPAPGQDIQQPPAGAPMPPAEQMQTQPPAGQAEAPVVTTTPTDTASGERFLQAQDQSHYLATRLTGRDVHNAAGQSIGNLNDLLIDKEGNIVAVIVGVGGFLGLGQKDVAVNWEFVQASGGLSGDRLVMGMTEDELRAAPAFERLDRQARTAETPAAGGQTAGGGDGTAGTRTQ